MLCDLDTLWPEKSKHAGAEGSILPNHNPWESHVINPHKFGLLDLNSSVPKRRGILVRGTYVTFWSIKCMCLNVDTTFIYIIYLRDIYRILQYKTSSKQFHITKSMGSNGASTTTAPDLAPPLTDDAEEPPVAAILKLQLPHVADIQEWYVWVKLRLSPSQVHTRMDFWLSQEGSWEIQP